MAYAVSFPAIPGMAFNSWTKDALVRRMASLTSAGLVTPMSRTMAPPTYFVTFGMNLWMKTL